MVVAWWFGWWSGYCKWTCVLIIVGLAGQLSQAGVSMGSFHQSSGLNPISHSVPTTGPSMYQSHYGLNTLGW